MMNSILQNIAAILQSIAALATVAICVFTAVYVRLTRKTLIHQLRPNVVVRAIPDDLHGRLINLEIVNFGYGAAMDVRCELIGQFLPLHYNESEMPEDFGPLSSGIEFLAPNESIAVFWNNIERVKYHLEHNKIEVICRYKSQDGIEFYSKFPISISHYLLTYDRQNPTEKIAVQLEKIAKEAKSISGKIRR